MRLPPRDSDLDEVMEEPAVADRAKPATDHSITTRRRAPASLLVVIAFLAGAALMVVELAGIRLLAPVFGSSLYTWTALIGVVLIAFGLGGYLGGRLADRTTDLRALAMLLFTAALAIVLVPPLNRIAFDSVTHLGLISGPTLLSLILFSVPGIVLGTVSPFVTRLLALHDNDRRIGTAAGLASAAGTLGSFVGTFASGFVLVPSFGVRSVFLGTAIAIAIAGLLLLASARVRPRVGDFGAGTVVAIGAFALWLGSTTRPLDTTVEIRESRYQRIQVVDTDGAGGITIRRLFHDTVQQGALELETDRPGLPYQRYWRLADTYLERLDRALVFGGGTFGIPRALADAWPTASITTIELDPAVVETARRHFRFEPDARNRVIVSDARRALRRDESRYDFIVGDAYDGVRSIPAHLVTREFFTEIRDHLSRDGIYLMNVIGASEGHQAVVFDAIRHTLASVFDELHIYAAYDRPAEIINNLLIVAGDTLPEPDARGDPVLARLLRTRVKPPPPADPVLLVDDYSPIEALIARTLGVAP